MPGFMDNYLQNGREEEQNMFDPYSDMNYMGQEELKCVMSGKITQRSLFVGLTQMDIKTT